MLSLVMIITRDIYVALNNEFKELVYIKKYE